MRKKLGLALGAGGARGVAHVGFLQALEEAGITADYVSGCSMGAVVGACYCAGVTASEMQKQIAQLRITKIASLNALPIKNNGLLRLNKARKMIVDLIGEKSFDELKIPFLCVATDVITGKTVPLSTGNVADAALASSSIPGVFTPAEIGEYRFVDGGILERVPYAELRDMGADVIVAVDVLGDLTLKEVPENLVGTLLRCIDIMDTRLTESKRRLRKKYVDLWLEPALGAMDQYKVKQKNMQFAYDKGYELGKANAEKIARLIEE